MVVGVDSLDIHQLRYHQTEDAFSQRLHCEDEERHISHLVKLAIVATFELIHNIGFE